MWKWFYLLWVETTIPLPNTFPIQWVCKLFHQDIFKHHIKMYNKIKEGCKMPWSKMRISPKSWNMILPYIKINLMWISMNEWKVKRWSNVSQNVPLDGAMLRIWNLKMKFASGLHYLINQWSQQGEAHFYSQQGLQISVSN